MWTPTCNCTSWGNNNTRGDTHATLYTHWYSEHEEHISATTNTCRPTHTHELHITPKDSHISTHTRAHTHQLEMNYECISPTPSSFAPRYVHPLNPPSPWRHNPLNFSPALYHLPLTPSPPPPPPPPCYSSISQYVSELGMAHVFWPWILHLWRATINVIFLKLGAVMCVWQRE